MINYNGLRFENRTALQMYKSMEGFESFQNITFSNETVISKEIVLKSFESYYEMIILPVYEFPKWYQDKVVV